MRRPWRHVLLRSSQCEWLAGAFYGKLQEQPVQADSTHYTPVMPVLEIRTRLPRVLVLHL